MGAQFGTGLFNLGTNLFDSTLDIFKYLTDTKIAVNQRKSEQKAIAYDNAYQELQEQQTRQYNSPEN